MIKRLNVLNCSECEDGNVYNRIDMLINKGYEKFKYDGDESIFYKPEDREEISKYLGIEIKENSGENLNEYIRWFDGGEYLQVTNRVEILISDCIEKLQEKLEEYEERIWASDNIYEEITKILKEQAYKVFTDIIKEGFEIINNGNFEWE
jgi:hypothetical protein